jgi:hypothetical protein
MTQKNEMSARALGMEELEMVNGGRGAQHGGGNPNSLGRRIKNGLGYVWWSITH